MDDIYPQNENKQTNKNPSLGNKVRGTLMSPWRSDSMLKCTCCFCKEHRFSFKHSRGSPQLPAFPVPGYSMTLSGLHWHVVHIHPCRPSHNVHKIKINLKGKNYLDKWRTLSRSSPFKSPTSHGSHRLTLCEDALLRACWICVFRGKEEEEDYRKRKNTGLLSQW